LINVDEYRLVAQFMDFVGIDSPSFGEAAFLVKLEKELSKLGLSVKNDKTGKDGVGNLYTMLPGKAPHLPPILICAHMDTVEPGKDIKPRIEGEVIKSDGTTILGADNKSAIAAILEVINQLKIGRIAHGDIEFLFTWGEERGHQGAKQFDASRIRSKIGFVPDGEGNIGTIITSAPYYNSLNVTFYGRASHAGISPERGINALVMASRVINRITLGRIDDETTANFGSITGGIARNVVPDKINMVGEIRSLNLSKLEEQVEVMKTVIEDTAREMGGEVQVEIKREFNGYKIKENELPVHIAITASTLIGLEPHVIKSCGGSDANELNAKGIKTIVLGMGGHDFHSNSESIAISELVSLTKFLAAIVVKQ
jgi:tripeptide aminopeptidase